MTKSAPDDLAVTFRSIPRRLREARGDQPDVATSATTAAIDAELARAAGLLRASSQPLQIADAIEAVANNDWDESTLDQLRSIALEIGQLLRTLSAGNTAKD